MKLERVKGSLEGEFEKINEEITRTMVEYQGKITNNSNIQKN